MVKTKYFAELGGGYRFSAHKQHSLNGRFQFVRF